VTIRVLVADDQVLVRTGLRTILEDAGGFDVVGEAADGVEALDRVAAVAPDVVLMDVRMPRLDGIAATREIRARPGAPRVLVLTTFDLDEYVFAGLRAGASGFLLKDTPRGAGTHQRRDRPPALPLGGDREDPRQPPPWQALAARPRAGGRAGLRDRTGAPGS
jgi:CheY-like chemotaxis protein